MDFRNSRTKENLMRAFAGESMARNRYLFAAAQAHKEKQYVIEAIFKYTADQEKEHGEIYYNFLKEELKNETVVINAGYPVDNHDDIIQVLLSSQHNEYEEYDPMYKLFGDIAKEEGYSKIATAFHMISSIEKTHGDRFGRYAHLLKENELFHSEIETSWTCIHCGHVHYGKSAPKVCPVCKEEQGYFIRFDMAPFEGKAEGLND